MAEKARILYDFDGDTENGELIIKEGAVVTILNKDIGDGWWEGELENGESGLFPETYVEILEEGAEEDVAGPMNGYEPVNHWDEDNEGGGAMNEDEYNQDSRHDSFGAPPKPAEPNKWDEEEDWEVQQREEEYHRGEADATSSGTGGGATGSRTDMNSPSGRSNSQSQIARAGTVRKNINRFSSFVKTGSENFILGRFPAKIAIQPGSKNKIVASPDNNTSPMWEPNPEPYTLEVRDPEKKKKFKGIKSFLAYSVIPTSTGRAVSRRYKHYAWLHDRLEEKFSIHCVPPLPDKQYYGRYGEDFVEKRREKLQRWSNRIARHPVISRSDVFIHFIHCDDEGQQWKTGKRRAEKDEVIGPVYLQTFHHPDVSIDVPTAELTVEKFGMFMHRFKLNLSRLRLKFIDHCQQMSGPFMTEFHKMSVSFNGLASTFALEDQEYAASLTTAIKKTSSTYEEIGQMHASQPRNDMLPALDVMKEYLGLIFAFPDVVTIHRGAAAKVKECEKMKEEGRIDYTDATEITSRAESVSAVVLSEIHHFQHERIIDFREMFKTFLGEQITFYTEIVRKLEEAKSEYNDGTDL